MIKKILPHFLFLAFFGSLFCFGASSLLLMSQLVDVLPGSKVPRSFFGAALRGEGQFDVLVPLLYVIYSAWVIVVIADKKEQSSNGTLSKFIPIPWSAMLLGIILLFVSLLDNEFRFIAQELETESSSFSGFFFRDTLIIWSISFFTSLLYLFTNKRLLLLLFPMTAFFGLVYIAVRSFNIYSLYEEMGMSRGLPLQVEAYWIILPVLIVIWLIVTLAIFLPLRKINPDRLETSRLLMFWTGIWFSILATLSIWVFATPFTIAMKGLNAGARQQSLVFDFVRIIIGALTVLLVVWHLAGRKKVNWEIVLGLIVTGVLLFWLLSIYG